MTQVVLVTGCSSGIGRATALGLHAHGYQVFATARRTEDLQALQEAGVTALYLDLNDPMSIAAAIETVVTKTGGQLDAVVSNAAYALPGAIEDIPRDLLRAQFEANVLGCIDLIQQVIPIMRKQGHGRIVQISSILGIVTMPYRGAYCATKYAIESLADALRMELNGSGIEMVLVEPGPIVSQFRANARTTFETNLLNKESVHKAAYNKLYQQQETAKLPFALPPEAVVKKIVHALSAKRPKARYYVTVPAYFLMVLDRLLPSRILDWVMSKLGE